MSLVDLSPAGDLLIAYASQKLNWATVLSEWIDNSLDAGATTVSIEFAERYVRITDDGHGCADLTAMFRLGLHARHAGTRLGRFGIGGKEAALWVGGLDSTIRIRTVHGAVARSMSVNWRELSESNWQVEGASETPLAIHDQAGTDIIVKPTVKKPPSGEAWGKLLEELGYWYTPAIKHGRQIKIKRPTRTAEWVPLKRWEPPKFQDNERVDCEIVVNGQGARVFAGIVREGDPNPRAGFTYLHEWRVIEAASSNGCGGYSPARICGIVQLDPSWKLTKNKDGIAKDATELYAEVERVCSALLRKADTMGVELQSRQLLSDASERLNAALVRSAPKRAKAKRQRGDSSGTIIPVETGRKHTRAEVEQPGQTFISKAGADNDPGRWRIDYSNQGAVDTLGQVKKPTVLLNRDNPYIDQLRRENETAAIVSLATTLIVFEFLQAPNGQIQLPGIEKGSAPSDFSKAVGSILAGLHIDGKPALKRLA